jgi:hypothetical protein
VGVGASLAAWAVVSPALAISRAGCGFKAMTGAPCPGCGMTRACLALARGDLVESVRLHPLAPALVLGGATLLALSVAEGATGRPWLSRPWRRHGARWATAGLVLLAVVWAVRVWVVPGSAPDPIPPDSPAGRLLAR